MRDLRTRYGPTAFVAGASEGLGRAFALGLAARGLDVVLAARREGPLAAVAEEVRNLGVTAHPIVLDLSADDLRERLEGLDHEIGLLVHNAAHAPAGPFLETPLDDHLRAVDVNVRSLLICAHVLGGRMAARGHGGILVVSSLVGFQGTPLLAGYAATKSFGRILAEGLWDELRAAGVDVLASCAGATRTPGYERQRAAGGPAMEPEDVASESLAALERGPVLVPGRFNRAVARTMRPLPRGWAVRATGSAMRRVFSNAKK